jgi:rfaE bifunctional protein nucleotidyltransferase chain/domain
MKRKTEQKILLPEDLIARVADLKRQGKVVVQSHGVFDLIHPGHVTHLASAREQGDVLVVTVIKDRDVRRGPGRPVFPERARAENVASLEMVDLVAIVDDETPFSCIKQIRPDIFARGQAQTERDRTIHRKIFEAEKELYLGASRLFETRGISHSSSGIINRFLDIYPQETQAFLKRFAERFSFPHIARQLDSLADMKVLVIGDGIIDEYHYTESMGKAAKAHLVVSRYLAHEVFAGGAFAVANHLAGLCDHVRLVSLLGVEDSREVFIRENLKPNVQPTFFVRDDGPTIIKKRYVNQYLNQKLFEVNYLSEDYIGGEREQEIIRYLEEDLPAYDLVVVTDFGHGLITEGIIRTVERHARVLAVNTQTNSANRGFNMITKYRRPNFICLDEPEVRLAAQKRFEDIEDVVREIFDTVNPDCIITTLGKHGSIGIDRDGVVNRTPIFSSKVIDTVGAGDAFFAYTAPCFAKEMPLDLISFIGNAVGALAVQIVGNKSSVEKHDLLAFVNGLLK